jgi:AraC-like DNA-binding protein
MKVSFIKPQPQLALCVAAIWIFESGAGVPISDSRIVVPDGHAKILIPYKNPLSVTIADSLFYASEQQIFLTGIQNKPRTICSPEADAGTIGIELTPKGLYHLFHLSMSELTDRIYSFEDLFGAWGRRLQTILGDIEEPDAKIAQLQITLTHLMHQNTNDFSLLDHTIERLIQSHGMTRIQELARETGYSRRYLDMLFREHVGLSPKSLASILRFQSMYRGWMQVNLRTFSKDSLYAHYYDQAHFIKEFKRFTGYTPQKYAELVNAFGKAFYQ